MKYWTFLELKEKVEADLDLEGEDFISADDLLGFANEAIDEVERQIHTLYEDYFVTRGTITLVAEQEEYDLPSDIYAHKIRGLVYRNAQNVYPVPRIKDWRKFEEYEVSKASGSSSSSRYAYMIVNSTAGSPKILLAPTPTEAGPHLKIWYLRNANRLINDASVLDIPEAANYVMQYIKVRCYEKEVGHPNLQKAVMDLENEKAETIKTLEHMVPDNDNELQADLSSYNEMS